MVERLVRNEEVRGSIPLGSTKDPIYLVDYKDILAEWLVVASRFSPHFECASLTLWRRLWHSLTTPSHLQSCSPSSACSNTRGNKARDVATG